MAVLSGKKIQRLCQANDERIIIDPFNKEQVNPNSYNLKLHNELLVYEEDVLDMKGENKTKKLTIPEDGLVLEPGKLYLGRTVEHTTTKGFVPMLEGRSSVGRLGLAIHITAGFGDISFSGFWTLELYCIEPVKIYPWVEICQIYYHKLEGDYEPYQSKYQDNKDIQPSMMYKDF